MKIVHGRRYTVLAPTGQYLIVEVYPVGLMAEIETSWRVKRYKLRLKTITRHIKKHEWRALKNHFNGYLAEPDIMPGNLRRCGSGWTRGRAYRDLRRRVRRSKC